jgi:branched-chain amino acid transport system permease protein
MLRIGVLMLGNGGGTPPMLSCAQAGGKETMSLLIDIVLAGIVLGGMYALIAMGLTLQYGVARIMNLSHGESLVAAAFGAHAGFSALALSPLIGLLVALPLGFAVNWLVYQIVLMPLVRRARSRAMLEVDSILATFGLLFVVQGIMLVMFGGQFYTMNYLSVPVNVLGSTVALNRLIALAFALVIGTALYLALTRTRRGTAIRAVAVDPVAAQLVAIDVRRTSAFAFALGGALAAAGGVLISMFMTFTAAMGVVFTMKALIVVIMGGVGNMLGALVAGLLLGLAETAVARLVDPGLTIAVTYALFLGVLLWRPTGLFGRSAR